MYGCTVDQTDHPETVRRVGGGAGFAVCQLPAYLPLPV